MLAVVSGLSGLAVTVLQIAQHAQDTREQSWAHALFNRLLIQAAIYLWRSLHLGRAGDGGGVAAGEARRDRLIEPRLGIW